MKSGMIWYSVSLILDKRFYLPSELLGRRAMNSQTPCYSFGRLRVGLRLEWYAAGLVAP